MPRSMARSRARAIAPPSAHAVRVRPGPGFGRQGVHLLLERADRRVDRGRLAVEEPEHRHAHGGQHRGDGEEQQGVHERTIGHAMAARRAPRRAEGWGATSDCTRIVGSGGLATLVRSPGGADCGPGPLGNLRPWQRTTRATTRAGSPVRRRPTTASGATLPRSPAVSATRPRRPPSAPGHPPPTGRGALRSWSRRVWRGAALMLVVLVSTGSLDDGGDLRSAGSPGRVVTTVTPIALVERFHQGVLAVQADRHGAATTGSAVVLRTDGYLVTALGWPREPIPSPRCSPTAGPGQPPWWATTSTMAWRCSTSVPGTSSCRGCPARAQAPQATRPWPWASRPMAARRSSPRAWCAGVGPPGGHRGREGPQGGPRRARGARPRYPGAADGGGLFGAARRAVGLCMPAADRPSVPSSSSTLPPPAHSTSTSTSGGATGHGGGVLRHPVVHRHAGHGRHAPAGRRRHRLARRQGACPHRDRGQALEPDRAAVLPRSPRSPAAAVGLRRGDVVLRIGGVRASSLSTPTVSPSSSTPGSPSWSPTSADRNVTRATVAPDATTTTSGRRVELTHGLEARARRCKATRRPGKVRRMPGRPHRATAPGVAGRAWPYGPAWKAAT